MTTDLAKALENANARVAEAEQETLEQARLNGMGTEREASLLGKITRLERALLVADGHGGILDQLYALVNEAYKEGFMTGKNDEHDEVGYRTAWDKSKAIIKLQSARELRDRIR